MLFLRLNLVFSICIKIDQQFHHFLIIKVHTGFTPDERIQPACAQIQ